MSNAWLAAVAALTGASVMVLELMAVRLMAPWFGQSQPVWTNVIGVVLAALAAGQWLGGRWAAGGRGLRPATLLLLAGAWSLALPHLVAALGSAVVPDELPLLEAYPFVTWGSLLVALVSLGLPLLALGALTPWLVHLSLDAREQPGRVAGRLLGAGTVGSLAGTFGATHVLLAAWGSAGAVRFAGALAVAVGLLVLRLQRRRPGAALALLLVPVAAAALPGRPPLQGTLLESRETAYQLARVVELEDGTRALRLEEGLDSFHSLHRPGAFWSGTYFDAFLAPSLMAPVSPDGRRDVLVVGLAAGTMASQLLRVAPDTRVRGVEIDREVVELGRRWFGLPEEVDVVDGADGRVALAADPGRYGAVLVDAYAQQIYLPAHLCTVEWFRDLHEHLLDGGIAALNIGGTSREDPVVHAVAGTFAEVFPDALVGRVPGTRNMLVLGVRGGTPPPSAWRSALAGWELPAPEDGVGGLDALFAEGVLATVDPLVHAPLRDGDAPVEALAHASWSGGRVDLSARLPSPDVWTSPRVGAPPEVVFAAARRAMALTRWDLAEKVLGALVDGDAPPDDQARAELLLGNVAFERGDFEDAIRHYEAAGASDPAPPAGGREVARTAAGNVALAAPLRDRRRAFEASGQRLRLAVLAVALFAAAGVAVATRAARPTPAAG